jgi:hypothetical protein
MHRVHDVTLLACLRNGGPAVPHTQEQVRMELVARCQWRRGGHLLVDECLPVVALHPGIQVRFQRPEEHRRLHVLLDRHRHHVRECAARVVDDDRRNQGVYELRVSAQMRMPVILCQPP